MQMRKHTLEIWKDIKGYEGYYQVSNLGRIKSLKRLIKVNNNGILYYKNIKERYLINIVSSGKSKNTNKYISCTLALGNVNRTYQVHRLVLEAFIGKCPKGMEACHNDGNKTNNSLHNLRWDTHINNMKDIRLHEVKYNIGENNDRCKLSPSDVIKIRNDTRPARVLALLYNMHYNTIRQIKRKELWQHI